MTEQEFIRFANSAAAKTRDLEASSSPAKSSPLNIIKFAPQEHVFIQGDKPKGIYKVLKGTVILYRLMADGRRQIQSFVSGGEYLAMTFADRHDVSAEAITPAEILCTPRSAFDRRLQCDAEFRQRILTMMGSKLQNAREQALMLGRKSAMERTASFLLFLDGRFRNPETGYVEIRMSRCDIADYLGLTLETVSRMMNKLKQRGIIDLPQATRFTICKHERLTSLAGEVENFSDIAA